MIIRRRALLDNLDDDGDKDGRDRIVVVACAHLDGEGGAGLWSKISPALLCHRSLHNPLVYKVLLVYMHTSHQLHQNYNIGKNQPMLSLSRNTLYVKD